ncbi:MAG TPA: DUF1579 domain-containing protein [Solimonas sp.]|nr:DUF1579 domain-containing protein [Solimonas sp.]
MQAEVLPQHQWLQKLVGEWTCEMDCSMGPDQSRQKFTGTESVRSIGGVWIQTEGHSQMPDGNMGTTVMTLGYNPLKQRFVGSFVGSMMTWFWLYDGQLDAGGKVLTLDSEGPSFSGDGSLSKYQDIIEWRSDDHRLLVSQIPGPDGRWQEFMTAHYRRRK